MRDLTIGTITKAYRTNDPGTEQLPAFQYDVRPDVMTPRSESDVLTAVPFMVGGFSPTDQTGVIYVPTVGTRVVVGFTDTGPVILGCLTGPYRTTSAAQPLSTSYNAGIDRQVSRREFSPTSEDMPHWAGPLEEGDISLGRGTARFKVNSLGAWTGTGPSCYTLHGFDGRQFNMWTERVDRGVGYWEVHDYLRPIVSAPGAQVPTKTAHSYVWDVDPYAVYLQPYAISRRGYVPSRDVGAGRAAVAQPPLPAVTDSDVATKRYAVFYDAVFQPLATSDVAMFQHHVLADGSWHLAGGPETFAFSFNAVSRDFSLKVGTLGLQITANAVTGKVDIKALDITVQAVKSLTLSSAQIDITAAAVNMVTQTLSVSGGIVAGAMTAGGIPYAMHTHGYKDDGSPAITTAPIG